MGAVSVVNEAAEEYLLRLKESTNPDTAVIIVGCNNDVDTASAEDVWAAGGSYNWPAVAQTMSIVSNNAADDLVGTGARTLTIEGLDSTYTEVSEDIDLDGVTPVVTTQTFLRVNSMYCPTAGSGDDNTGIITATGSTSGVIHAWIAAATSLAHQAVYTVPADKVLEVDFIQIAMRQDTAAADAQATIHLLSRDNAVSDAAWRVRYETALSAVGTSAFEQTYPSAKYAFTEKTDVRVRVASVTDNNTQVMAKIVGRLKAA